ncbi:methyltransferase [Nesterenkonia alkaliphila]|nr:methyltransferase [Nesterenkonia alkaliphila]
MTAAQWRASKLGVMTAFPPVPGPPSAQNIELIEALREDFIEAGFTNDGVAELLGAEAVAALDREQVVPGQLRVQSELSQQMPSAEADSTGGPAAEAETLSQSQRCAVLTALWLVAVPVTYHQVQKALPRTGVEGLRQLGLAVLGPEAVWPACDLRPYLVETRAGSRDLWVTSDLSSHQVTGALPKDHVLGVGQASLTLAGITHRRPVQTALDIGTGCGIQLLHLLDHAEHVTGTDLSPRALDFARFNLLLNAPALELDPRNLEDRVELLEGSLLEPVAGRTFDLVVSNPPFVITPRQAGETESDRYTYRDGGREGDALMQELIAGLPAVLNPSGTAQMLGNWESSADEAWDARPRSWVSQAGLSAWFIQRDEQTPAEYAETWLRDASEERSIQDYRRRYGQYIADFASRGVQQIGFGLIWLQKPAEQQEDTTPWLRFEQLTGEIQQPLGPVIGQTVQRALAAHTDEAGVLQKALHTPETITEERYQRFGAEHPEVIIARQGTGLRRSRPISSAAAGFLAAADGEFTAAQLITAVCSLTETEEDTLTQEVLDLYIEGYVEGYVEQ